MSDSGASNRQGHIQQRLSLTLALQELHASGLASLTAAFKFALSRCSYPAGQWSMNPSLLTTAVALQSAVRDIFGSWRTSSAHGSTNA